MKYSVIFSAQVLSLLLQVLRLIFVVGCQFDERFPYENVEALARQSLAFLRLSMKVFFGLHRTVPCRMRALRDKIDLFGLFHADALGLICRKFMGPPLPLRNPNSLAEAEILKN